MAKNFMRRTVREILDPPPSAKQFKNSLRGAFEGRCAYCLTQLPEAPSGWDIDHADPEAGNHVGNLLPSCKSCNGDEKREQGWLSFLQSKLSGIQLEQQEARIRAWISRHPRSVRPASPDVAVLASEIEGLIELFGTRCSALRKLARAAASSDIVDPA